MRLTNWTIHNLPELQNNHSRQPTERIRVKRHLEHAQIPKLNT